MFHLYLCGLIAQTVEQMAVEARAKKSGASAGVGELAEFFERVRKGPEKVRVKTIRFVEE